MTDQSQGLSRGQSEKIARNREQWMKWVKRWEMTFCFPRSSRVCTPAFNVSVAMLIKNLVVLFLMAPNNMNVIHKNHLFGYSEAFVCWNLFFLFFLYWQTEE